MLPRARLAELGYAIAIFPALGFLAMGAPVALHGFAAFGRLMGFEDVWAFDRN